MVTMSRRWAAGWWRLFLAAVAVVVVGLLGATISSVATLPVAETRVGDSTVATADVVGVRECVSAGQRWAKAPPQGELTVGFCVAAKTESRLLSKVDDLPCNCFVAGTTVQTSEGAKPIEDVRSGDLVWAKNLASGESELRPVTGLFQKKSTTLMTITLATGATVVVTQEHPFMVDGEGWVLSGDLRVGDQLTQRNGGIAVIAAIDARPGGQSVYNFEVAGDHNYYITDAQLLVHNCPIGEFGPSIISRTVGKGKGWRIDVENPAPGVRDGQMHMQGYSGGKWQYDFAAGEFVGLPKSLAKVVARDPAGQRAVQQGLRYLGEGG